MHLGVPISHRPVGPNQVIHSPWENWFVLNGISCVYWAIEDCLEARIEAPILVANCESGINIRSVSDCIQGWKLPPRGISIVAYELVNVCIV